MPQTTIIHFSGKLDWIDKRGSHTMMLGGFAVCCTGDRAYAIRRKGNQTDDPKLVTCRACRDRLSKAGKFESTKTVWDHLRENLDDDTKGTTTMKEDYESDKKVDPAPFTITSQKGHPTLGTKGQSVYIDSGHGASESTPEGKPMAVPGNDGDIVLRTGGTEAIRFQSNGDVFVRGQKVATDRETYLGFREWLATALYRHDENGFVIKGR